MTAQSPHPAIGPQNIYPGAANPVAFQPPVALGHYEDDLDFGQLLQILRRRWLVIGGVALAVSGAIWSWTLTRTPIFQGSFRVLIESVDEANPSNRILFEDVPITSTVDYGTQIEVLKSPALLEPIARELQATYPDLTPGELAINLSIGRLRDTKVLAVSYRHPDAQRIQEVLEEVATQYLDYSFEQRQASLQQGIQFVDDKLPELRDRVTTLQVRLERFRQQYSILDPETRGHEISGLLTSVESQRQAVQAELAQAQALYQTLQGQLKTTPEAALTGAALSESTRYQALLNQLQEVEAEIAVQSARYQPNSPQIEALKERRDNLRPLLEEEALRILGPGSAPSSQSSAYLSPTELQLNLELIRAANNLQELQARNRELARIEGDIKEEFDLVPGLARQYTDLQRELGIATESLNRFLTTRETLQIDAAQKSIPWQLISAPNRPTVPISPNIPRNLIMGMVAGVLMGSAAALLTEKLDQVFHSPDDLKQAVPFPLLGVIPYLAEVKEQTARLQMSAQFQQNGTNGTATGHGMAISNRTNRMVETVQSSMFLEAFRSLSTNVKFLGTDHPIQSIVISSAIPGEGKTTNALYLARAAAIMGQNVLLVDADLRAPKHHDYLNLTNIRGLSNAISDTMNVMSLVQRSPIEQNLSVLTAGPKPPDPVKLLSSKRMQSLMDELKQHYDLIVYDAPPLIGFADSSLLATHTDGIVLVVGLGRTERSVLSRALDDIKILPVSILGMVANGIKSYTTPAHGNYSYYRYYGDRNQHGDRNQQRNQRPNAAEASSVNVMVGAAASASGVAVPPVPSAGPDSNFPSNPTHDQFSPSGYPEADGDPTPDAAPSSFGYGEKDGATGAGHGFSPYESEPYGADDLGAPPAVTVHQPISPLSRLQPWQWSLAGLVALAVSSLAGWSLYSRVLNPSPEPQPLPRPSPSNVDGVDNQGENPDRTPDRETPQQGSDHSSSTESEASTGASPETEAEAASHPAFADAVRLAQSALSDTETATTAQDWSKIAKQWQEASTLMATVPDGDPRFETARNRTVTYRSNGEYARQQVLQLLQNPN